MSSKSTPETEPPKRFLNLNEALIASWIIFSGWCVITGITLSSLGELNRVGYLVALVPGLLVTAWPVWLGRKHIQPRRAWESSVWRQPIFFLYLSCLILSLVGGVIHDPNNYDALVYRLPRLTRWLDQEQYHWIGHFCIRMDFSSLGHEWLMLPGFAIFNTLRIAFLPNIITLLLLPGCIHASFSALGIKRSIVSFWMWAIPCASCYVMQSGSIGNDITATVYCLAAVLFCIRAGKTGQAHHIFLAAVAAGLLTCAKVSNLPLLLPVAACGIMALVRAPKLWIASALALPLAALVSFLPLAVMNTKHTGHWSGNPGSVQNLSDPIAGIAGNTLQIGTAALTPPVFPLAGKANLWLEGLLSQRILSGIRSEFPEFGFGFTDMAVEEGAGLGIGLSIVALLWLIGSRSKLQFPPIRSETTWVALAFWAALIVVMAKLGNPGVPRIIAPYYAGLFLLLLLFAPADHLPSKRWFAITSTIVLSPILVALVSTPSRPLLRLDRLLVHAAPSLKGGNLHQRMQTVYDVYATRSSLLVPVRSLLHADERLIGFAGDDCDSEYFFWFPLGQRKVIDFKPTPDKSPPGTAGLDAIVVSETGSQDRFGLPPQALADKLGWEIHGGVPIRRLARTGVTQWFILRPAGH